MRSREIMGRDWNIPLNMTYRSGISRNSFSVIEPQSLLDSLIGLIFFDGSKKEIPSFATERPRAWREGVLQSSRGLEWIETDIQENETFSDQK